ncbi:hypothetical protein F2Q69_00034619 [Brassica cretica]|uniref:Uncharacterized protein n=1 Tax=Brassica cretica TaxID=69181 RepID=A0A8S9SCN9_BRACR|nr:hypothetical protein F2Q69_00034619 [Brassica cretica]
MKAVLSFIAKDVVGVVSRGPKAFVEIDRPSMPELSCFKMAHGETKPKSLDPEPVQSQFRGQDLGLLLVLGGAMTNSAYVSRYSFNLIPYRFKVRDRYFSRKIFLQASATSRNAEDWFLFRMPSFVLEMFTGLNMLCGIARVYSLNPAFEKHFGLSTDVCSQNCCSCLALICDLGVRTKGSHKFFPGKRHPPILCFVRCWPSEMSFVYI